MASTTGFSEPKYNESVGCSAFGLTVRTIDLDKLKATNPSTVVK
jgi:hypothetical protein